MYDNKPQTLTHSPIILLFRIEPRSRNLSGHSNTDTPVSSGLEMDELIKNIDLGDSVSIFELLYKHIHVPESVL